MWPCLIVQRSLRTPTEPSFENCCTRGIHGLVFGSVFKRARARAEHIQICAHSTRRLCTVGQDHATSSSDRRAIECTKNRQCSLNHLSDFEFVGRHIAPLLLALRSRADSVAHISKFFRPFKEPPFSALPLFIRSRWIKKPVQLRRSQVESRRSSFLGSRLDWLRYCERLLEKTANGFRTGQLSILTRNPSIQSRKLGRL
jgi:hypothetical protein